MRTESVAEPLSAALQRHTAAAHERAENSGFVSRLLGGESGPDELVENPGDAGLDEMPHAAEAEEFDDAADEFGLGAAGSGLGEGEADGVGDLLGGERCRPQGQVRALGGDDVAPFGGDLHRLVRPGSPSTTSPRPIASSCACRKCRPHDSGCSSNPSMPVKSAGLHVHTPSPQDMAVAAIIAS